MHPFIRAAMAAPLFISLLACGPTLTLGPTGWNERGNVYSIAPLEDGSLYSKGWALAGFTVKGPGFRRTEGGGDLELHRLDDDGVLVAMATPLDDEDVRKKPEVLAERWLERFVAHPNVEDRAVGFFEAAVPPLAATASSRWGFGWKRGRSSSTVLHGREVHVDQRDAFSSGPDLAVELTATLSPPGQAADRRLYLALIKQRRTATYVVIVYGNTPDMFERGLPEATDFAHRVHFNTSLYTSSEASAP